MGLFGFFVFSFFSRGFGAARNRILPRSWKSWWMFFHPVSQDLSPISVGWMGAASAEKWGFERDLKTRAQRQKQQNSIRNCRGQGQMFSAALEKKNSVCFGMGETLSWALFWVKSRNFMDIPYFCPSCKLRDKIQGIYDDNGFVSSGSLRTTDPAGILCSWEEGIVSFQEGESGMKNY